jgi:hypothetical protein
MKTYKYLSYKNTPMQIKTYKSIDKQQFLNFCKEQSLLHGKQSSSNMWSDDANNQHTLPYILANTIRFDGVNGEFFILFDNDKIAACGGVYISDFNRHIALAGVRTWVNQDYRHLSLHRDYLLVEHKKWCIERQVKLIALSFNDYNKNIIEIFKRNRLGEKNNRINNREPKHMFYTGIEEVGFPVMIQYTPQWVIYEKIDKDFKFDWSLLK